MAAVNLSGSDLLGVLGVVALMVGMIVLMIASDHTRPAPHPWSPPARPARRKWRDRLPRLTGGPR